MLQKLDISWIQEYLPASVDLKQTILLGSLGLAVFSSGHFIWFFMKPLFSPMRSIKGPPGGSFVLGHMPLSRKVPTVGAWHRDQLQKYGHVFVFKVLFNQNRLCTTDPKALQHVLNNSFIYQKPSEGRYILSRLLGNGLLFVEGDVHKRQRRIMNPAFGTLHIREMTEIFVSKSNELRDILKKLSTSDSSRETPEWTPVEMLSHLSCTTLDIIGLAGFNYRFDSLDHLVRGDRDESELSFAFSQILNAMGGFAFLVILKMWFPIFRLIQFDRRSRIERSSQKTIQTIGRKLVEERKQALKQEMEKGQVSKAKDLLTLLIRANLAESGTGGQGDKTLSDEEVMNQIPTFLVAGHETTSTATTWALYSLASHPDVQTKLREELLAFPSDTPTMEELNGFEYLDRVVRETLRYHGIVQGTARVAEQDDVIPLERPFTDKYGVLRHEIKIKKGDGVFIPIRVVNTLQEIWGDDSEEFNPDRWLDPPKRSASIPSAWGNQLSFIAGPRACIGLRFALVEMKALLFALIRSFEFKLAVDADDVIGKVGIVTRPALRSRPEEGHQLPLLIRQV
ncbi:hypothetical protein FRB91_007152 [Serendipita sp. 411]|nr:hypothetical protein FRC18_008842 [Serendipita sp. 400]KAG8851939.1 hypothetical protein FRB91_007152 [Serendipita sp. 411]